MVEADDALDNVRNNFVAELSEAALRVAARHHVHGPSVDQELDLWHALDRAVHEREKEGRWSGAGKEDVVAELTDAAYQVALDHGFPGSFLDLELNLGRAFCRVLRANRLAAALLGIRPEQHRVAALA
jgi:hypothetical protein